jgi:O-antigen/teichoic acid export membrane protein
MTLADRYVILFLIGTDHVAVYTVPATLVIFATQIQNFLEFLFPHISEEWKKNRAAGEAGCSGQASVLYHTMLRISALTALPLAAGIWLWGPSLVRILAGSAYTQGTVVFNYLIPLVIIIPFTSFVHFALMLDGRTKVIGGSILVAAALNVLLNIVLVAGLGPLPSLGIRGAALATTLSYSLLFVISLAVSGVVPHLRLSQLRLVPLTASCVALIAAALLLRNRLGAATLWEIPVAGVAFLIIGHVTRIWTREELLFILRRNKKAS